ncbi:MAG: HNH endonuclease [Bacteroidales bacterium]|nr:HNH endonuclease [Bacteroidales bacterium]
METKQIINIVKQTFSVNEVIPASQREINYTFEGIEIYKSGTYSQHFGKEIFVINTHTGSIKKANLFFEILNPLVIAMLGGVSLNSNNFHDIIEGIGWINNIRQYPDLTTLEPYYIAVTKLICKKLPFQSVFEKEMDFEEKIKESEKLTKEERLRRLSLAPKKPEKTLSSTVNFKRNPDVVVEVLLRAKGICECCKKNAPFVKRKDKSPYLEVHHIIQLSDGGDDTVQNAQALCPNCHREKHFGI